MLRAVRAGRDHGRPRDGPPGCAPASWSTTPSSFDYGTVDAGFYDFRHQLLRDALYRSTPEADRRRFHARAGEFGTRLEGQTEVHTSFHYERAGLRDEAYRSALEGARAAARVSAHRESFELYRRAVRNMPTDLPALERARLLDAYNGQAGAIEENEIGEQAAMEARQAYLDAGDGVAAASSAAAIGTYWRRNGRALSDRRRLIDAALIELQALRRDGARPRAGRLLYQQLVNDVDANDFEAARRVPRGRCSRRPARTTRRSYRRSALGRGAMADILAGDVDRGLDGHARVRS